MVGKSTLIKAIAKCRSEQSDYSTNQVLSISEGGLGLALCEHNGLSVSGRTVAEHQSKTLGTQTFYLPVSHSYQIDKLA